MDVNDVRIVAELEIIGSSPNHGFDTVCPAAIHDGLASRFCGIPRAVVSWTNIAPSAKASSRDCPWLVRVHAGAADLTAKTRGKSSRARNEINQIARDSRDENWLPTLDTFRTFVSQLHL